MDWIRQLIMCLAGGQPVDVAKFVTKFLHTCKNFSIRASLKNAHHREIIYECHEPVLEPHIWHATKMQR